MNTCIIKQIGKDVLIYSGIQPLLNCSWLCDNVKALVSACEVHFSKIMHLVDMAKMAKYT